MKSIVTNNFQHPTIIGPDYTTQNDLLDETDENINYKQDIKTHEHKVAMVNQWSKCLIDRSDDTTLCMETNTKSIHKTIIDNI